MSRFDRSRPTALPGQVGPDTTMALDEVEPDEVSDPAPDDEVDPEETAAAPEVPLLVLRDGLPPVVDTPDALAATVEAFAAGAGPVAIDAERASGYRYSARAYLIQLRREGSGTALVDPTAFGDLRALDKALGDAEWILHAATQDLPCLTELGLRPTRLFDTELAGRLLGYPRVGLATLVETIVGRRMRKEHSAVDWSTRPLPPPWLEYAALDVEALIELRDALAEELEGAGKAEWARQEFAHLVAAAPSTPRQDPWRRTSGMHRARGRRAVAAVRALWETRDAIASQRDVTPSRIIPDSAIIEAANALPRDRAALLRLAGFRGRGAQRYAKQWVEALDLARSLPEDELPPLAARYDGPPPPRSWAERNPAAAARLAAARQGLSELSERLSVPLENLLTPELVRRLMWEPPPVAPEMQAGEVAELVAEWLTKTGARPWQVELCSGPLAEAISQAPPQPV